jgi:outer membrane biosynthesis protein TonB
VTEDAWPTPRESSREPLPRVEDLPIAEQGYEQESVRAAFDSFYRHAAQLDASLRTLEAVDSFHRQAAALRSDLRTLRAAGWTQQSWNVTPAYGYGMRAPREGVPPAVWRVAGEAAFLIAAAVIVGVAKLDWWLIVLIMAGAFTIVLLIEWIAGRESYVAPRQVAPPPVVEGETVGERTAEEEASGWSAFEESQEPSDAMTMVGAPPVVEGESEPVEPEVEQPEPVAEVESQPEEEAPEPEPIPEPEPGPELPPAAEAAPEPEPEREPETAADADEEADQPRRRWWRREPEDTGIEQDEEPSAHEPPRHVRVLPPTGEEHDVPAVDSWERGFDEPDESEPTGEDAVAEVGEDTAEGEPAVTVDGEASDRRRFRRR